MTASLNGHVTVVRLLLEKGADVNICNKVVMDSVSCTCMWTFSQLAVCYICMAGHPGCRLSHVFCVVVCYVILCRIVGFFLSISSFS